MCRSKILNHNKKTHTHIYIVVSNTFDFGLKVLPAVADVILASIFRNRNEYDSLECVYIHVECVCS